MTNAARITWVVTGTGTGVGKTIVSAAVARLCVHRAESCTVVKPAQTGMPDPADDGLGDGDLAEVRRLAGGEVGLVELGRYPDPLAPATAARRSGRASVPLDMAVDAVRAAASTSAVVVVEGAGGLLVRYDESGWTIADLAAALKLPVIVVTTSGLGTLNATALTLEAAANRHLDVAGVVIGSWPDVPELADRCNVADLEALIGAPLAGAMPAGAAALDRAAFLDAAVSGLGPDLGGAFDAAAFRDRADG